MPLISLVYVSIESEPLSQDDLLGILTEARTNNQKLGITGMLLYRDGYFIQALEGEKKVVEPLYEQIAKDNRHKNVIKVYQHNVTQRSFGDWAMGFNEIEDQDLHHMEGFTDVMFDDSLAQSLHDYPDRAHKLLVSFRDRTFF